MGPTLSASRKVALSISRNQFPSDTDRLSNMQGLNRRLPLAADILMASKQPVNIAKTG